MINEDFQDQRDAYYEPLNPPRDETPDPLENIVIVLEGEYVHDEEGESRSRSMLLDVGTLTNGQVEQYVERMWPVQHCQHSYDCCGHWYQQFMPRIDRSGKFVLVTTSESVNI